MTVNLKPSYAYIIMIGFHKDFPQSQHKLISSLHDLINLLYANTCKIKEYFKWISKFVLLYI